jgi:hypothetical protein
VGAKELFVALFDRVCERPAPESAQLAAIQSKVDAFPRPLPRQSAKLDGPTAHAATACDLRSPRISRAIHEVLLNA